MSTRTIPPMIALLRLENPHALLYPTKPGVDGAAILQAMQHAMDGLIKPNQPINSALRHSILVTAGHWLLDRPGLRASALHLAEHAGADAVYSAPFINIRLRALELMKDPGALIRNIRPLAKAPLTENAEALLIDALKRNDIAQLIPLSGRLHAQVWGELHSDLHAQIKALEKVTPSPAVSEEAVEYLFERSTSGIKTFATYRARLIFGVNLSRYLFYVQDRAGNSGLNSQTSPQAKTADQILMRHWKQARDQLQTPDNARIWAEHGTERSALLLGAHAGTYIFMPRALDGSTLPQSAITLNTNPDSADTFNISTMAPDAALRFAKLIKMARRTPRSIFIYPDGAIGDTSIVNVLGRQMRIGNGAAALGYFTRAMPYFVHTILKNGQVTLKFRKGPVCDADMESTEYERLLNTFYVNCLGDILLGPPENIGNFVNMFNPPR